MKLLIDCNYLGYRALFTTGDLSYEQKRVGVIFGFIRQIFTLSELFKTKDLIFCWDSQQSYRKIIYPEYKANRHKNIKINDQFDYNDAYRQFDDLKEIVLPMMGFNNIFRQNGYEADDLIAWISMRIPDEYMIVTKDEDMLQLIIDNQHNPVHYYNFKGVTTEDSFTKAWFGLKPKQFAFVKAISGCTSDNIKGVEGVGDITAAKYLAGILKGKNTIAKIESDEAKELAKFNVRLTGLPFSGTRPIKISQIVSDDISEAKFKAIFGQYGFRFLLKEEQIEKWSKIFDR